MQLADRTNVITASMTLSISSKAKAMAAKGIDVCNFGAGEPDFETPLPVREAAKAALDAGKTKYTPTGGIRHLRELIADKLTRENALAYSPDQVMVSTGGKQAIFNGLMAVLNSGDEVLLPEPCWVSYPQMIKLASASPVFLPTTAATGFKLTPEALETAITDKTRLLILNSPSNPTGAVYTLEELRALTEVVVAHQIIVLSDEIYEKLVYDGRQHVSFGSLSQAVFDLTLTCNGFSKAYAATGWRLGYAAGPLPVIEAAINIQSHTTSSANTFAQYGAIAALEGGSDAIETMRQAFERRRDLMYEGVSAIPGLRCPKPAGAFYVFPDISATGLDSITFCTRLLEEEHVATVPGVAFGSDAHIRLSYATDAEVIEKGVTRLGRFVRALL
jgi:aspartate aminotransferase